MEGDDGIFRFEVEDEAEQSVDGLKHNIFS
jgi:hypothetical protein